MTKEQQIMIVVKIEAGLGDVNWGLYLQKHLKDKFEITLVFYNCKEKQEKYLRNYKNIKVQEIRKEEEIREEQGNYILLKSNIAQEEFMNLTEKFYKIINFHYNKKTVFMHPRIINIDEYGVNTEQVRLCFRDYSLDYKEHTVMQDGLLRINLTVHEFKNTFKFDCEEYDTTKVEKYLKQPYYLSYFSQNLCIQDSLSLFYFIKKLCKFSKLSKFTVLTNFWFSDLLSNTNFVSVEELVEQEIATNGISDNFYILYFCLQVANFELRTPSKCNIEIKYNDKLISCVSYLPLTKYEFDYLLINSEEIVGCTGDISFSEVISTNRMFVYQTLPHKLNFKRLLNNEYKKYYGIKDDFLLEFMFDPYLLEDRESTNDFDEFKNEWRKFCNLCLRNNSFLDWLHKEL